MNATTYFDEQTGIWRAYEGDAHGEGATESLAMLDLRHTLAQMQRDDIAEGDRSRAALIG